MKGISVSKFPPYKNGKVSFKAFRAVVLDSQDRTDTQLHSEVHPDYSHRGNTYTTVHSTVEYSTVFWVQFESGQQQKVTLNNGHFPVLAGQQLTMVYAENTTGFGRLVAFRNHNTGSWHATGYPIRRLGLWSPWNPAVVLGWAAAFLVTWYGFDWLITESFLFWGFWPFVGWGCGRLYKEYNFSKAHEAFDQHVSGIMNTI